jgi:hypothetical protein
LHWYKYPANTNNDIVIHVDQQGSAGTVFFFLQHFFFWMSTGVFFSSLGDDDNNPCASRLGETWSRFADDETEGGGRRSSGPPLSLFLAFAEGGQFLKFYLARRE